MELSVLPITLQDAPSFFSLIGQERENLVTYFPITTGRTTDASACADYVKDLIAQAVSGETFCFLIRIEDQADPVGAVFLKSFDRRVPKCELAYFVSAQHQRNGIATGALAWAVDEAFHAHGMSKVFLRIDPDNVASIRVAEKNGFAREGLLRQDFRTSDDRLLDVIHFGKLR